MIIGFVCPQCKKFISEVYQRENYEKKLAEWKEDLVVAEVQAKLDGESIKSIYAPMPTFYCEWCGIILEPPLEMPFNYAAKTKVDKWKERFND